MKFIDLFAGLGGFHVGLSKLGHECVFASEIDPELSTLYEKNFDIKPCGDIRKINASDIPSHDILCAGFPCQPFSVAGKKEGAQCPKSGKLIDEVLRITKYHKPEYVLLENVPQILTIQNNEFWDHIVTSFTKLEYKITHNIYSPEQFGIPQRRNRVFVVASKNRVIVLPKALENVECQIDSILQDGIPYRSLEKKKTDILEHWQLFLSHVNTITSHTILASEFGATYPLMDLSKLPINELLKYKGAFGDDLSCCTNYEEIMNKMPEYVRKNNKVPDWILSSVTNSRKIYEQYAKFLDEWKIAIKDCGNSSWQKLEWRAERTTLNLWNYIIQFRASGIRVSNTQYTPSLVAMTPTQIPIIGKQRRYLSPREAVKLQAMESLKYLPECNTRAFKALGNAVNAKIVYSISATLK